MNHSFFSFKLLLYPFFIILTFTAMHSCSFRLKRVFVENDSTQSLKRVRAELYHTRDQERRTPFYSSVQTILKEDSAGLATRYKVYDVLRLNPNAFNLNDTIYVLVDGKSTPLTIESMQVENFSHLSEDTETMLTADSSKVSVITGYKQHQVKVFKISYELCAEVIEKIKQAEDIRFRYYAGPNMITLRVRGRNMNTLQKVIAAD